MPYGIIWSWAPSDIIAFDSYSNKWSSVGTSHTFSHTTSGNNRILFVSILSLNAADIVSWVTYGGNAMARIWWAKLGVGTEWTYLYYIVAPTVGVNNIVVTTSISTTIFADSTSYTWAKQTAQPNASATNVIAGVTWPQTSVTSTEDNCWLVGVFRSSPETQTPVAGTTFRWGVNTTIVIWDSNWPKSPTGSYSLGVTNYVSNGIQIVAAFWPVP